MKLPETVQVKIEVDTTELDEAIERIQQVAKAAKVSTEETEALKQLRKQLIETDIMPEEVSQALKSMFNAMRGEENAK